MTKLLILSDSHNSRLAIENILAAEADSIDALIFLGDGLRDLEQALTFYPSLRAYAVAGNCDFGALEPLDGLAAFDGVVVFYTHGHMYGVKYDLDTLADAAAARGANVALFGHTHIPVAEERGGVFLFNPGSCGRCYTGPNTYGILTLADGKIIGCTAAKAFGSAHAGGFAAAVHQQTGCHHHHHRHSEEDFLHLILHGYSNSSADLRANALSLLMRTYQQKKGAAHSESSPLCRTKRKNQALACAAATAQATVAPTMGLLPMPIRPIISTCAGTEEEPAN